MRKSILALTAVAAGVALVSASGAFAGGDLSGQAPIEVKLELGKAGVDQHKFYPDKLTFETGKLYKLVVYNPSNSAHYFSSEGLASKVFTRKVQVMDENGTSRKAIGEIKGAIREMEIYPGGTAEWWFVPVSTGMVDAICTIKEQDGKTHAEHGMKANLTIM